MKRYIGYVMIVVGAVAIWDGVTKEPKADPSVIGLLVLLVLVPGIILARGKAATKDAR